MDWLYKIDWQEVLVPDKSILEIMVRGSLVYLILFCLLRLILKRQAGAVSITDMLVIVLIADAAQNAMSADYQSVPDGILLVATIIFWNYLLDFLGSKFSVIGKFVHPSPLPLIENGKMNSRNMRHELITKEELFSQLREQGIEKISEVKDAFLEGDGQISIIKYDKKI